MQIAKSNPITISLSEGTEPRVAEAAVQAVNLGIKSIQNGIRERHETYGLYQDK